MPGKTDDLEKKLENLKEKYHSALYGKSSKEIIQRLEREKSELERRLESKRKPSLFKRVKDSIGNNFENLTLLAAYGLEVYFLGPLLHEKMYSLASYLFEGYEGYIKKYTTGIQSKQIVDGNLKVVRPSVNFQAAMDHILKDGMSGIMVGALTGAAVGCIASLTYNVVKKKDFFPFESLVFSGFFCGLTGAVGGLIGAEFSNAQGILIGAYITSGLTCAKIIKDNDI